MVPLELLADAAHLLEENDVANDGDDDDGSGDDDYRILDIL